MAFLDYAYPSAAQQMPTPGLTPNSGSRSNSAPLVQPGAPTNPNTTAASMPHLGQSQHQMHQNMSSKYTRQRMVVFSKHECGVCVVIKLGSDLLLAVYKGW